MSNSFRYDPDSDGYGNYDKVISHHAKRSNRKAKQKVVVSDQNRYEEFMEAVTRATDESVTSEFDRYAAMV